MKDQKDPKLKTIALMLLAVIIALIISSMAQAATFRATAYCGCSKCCGKWAKYHKTASGTTPEQGRTVAVDPDQIPLGTHITINGVEYIAEDTGSGIGENRVDIYFNSHREALKFGVQDVEVEIIKDEEEAAK